MAKERYLPLTQIELSELDTNGLKHHIIKLLNIADDIYFLPITNPKSKESNEVPHEIVCDLNRCTIELTSRYMLAGF